MSNIRIPVPVKRGIKTLQKSGFPAVLAGGSIRDQYLGKHVADYDIFIKYEDSIATEDLNYFFGIPTSAKNNDYLIFKGYSPFEWINEPAYSSKDAMIGVANGIVAGEPIQAIVVDADPIEYVYDAFDINLCMCTFDGKAVTLSKQFFKDVRNKTLTFRDNISEYEFKSSLKRHVPKLVEKYSSYQVIYPEQFKHLVQK